MADTLKKLRIFAASPSDVANERARRSAAYLFGSNLSSGAGENLGSATYQRVSANATRITWVRISSGSWEGKATRFSASRGCPPIAYTSDKAFAAAMAP
jgi:hypothetical protein